MARTVLALSANTTVCRAFIRAVNVLLLLGWRPSRATADKMAAIAGRLIWLREVVETSPNSGFRCYRPGRMRISLRLMDKRSA